MWKYLDSYADHFELKKHIKFLHLVTNVHPIEKERWIVTTKNLQNQTLKSSIFDAVIVCNGHLFSPRIPVFDGVNQFRGKIFHSHDFRKAETFKGKQINILEFVK